MAWLDKAAHPYDMSSGEVRRFGSGSAWVFAGLILTVIFIGAMAAWLFTKESDEASLLPEMAVLSPSGMNEVEPAAQTQEAGAEFGTTALNIDKDEVWSDMEARTEQGRSDALPDVAATARNPAEGANVPVNDVSRYTVAEVIGKSVKSSSGQEAGVIHDILIDPKTKKAVILILDKEGREYERDLSALNFANVLEQDQSGGVMLSLSEMQAENAPEYFYNKRDLTNIISLRMLQNGQILDFERHLVGQIDAVIYANGQAQDVYFSVRPELAGRPDEIFHVPLSAVAIVRNNDGYDIVMNEEQTRALAVQVLN